MERVQSRMMLDGDVPCVAMLGLAVRPSRFADQPAAPIQSG